MACASHSLQASCPSPWQALPPLLWGDMLLQLCDGYGLNCNGAWFTWYGKVQIRNNLRCSEHPSQKLHGHICAYPTWTFHEICWILSLFTANRGCISEFGIYCIFLWTSTFKPAGSSSTVYEKNDIQKSLSQKLSLNPCWSFSPGGYPGFKGKRKFREIDDPLFACVRAQVGNLQRFWSFLWSASSS